MFELYAFSYVSVAIVAACPCSLFPCPLVVRGGHRGLPARNTVVRTLMSPHVVPDAKPVLKSRVPSPESRVKVSRRRPAPRLSPSSSRPSLDGGPRPWLQLNAVDAVNLVLFLSLFLFLFLRSSARPSRNISALRGVRPSQTLLLPSHFDCDFAVHNITCLCLFF